MLGTTNFTTKSFLNNSELETKGHLPPLGGGFKSAVSPQKSISEVDMTNHKGGLAIQRGFVINAEAAQDDSGTVSSAGDVNGDGLDDVIVGAWGASPDNQYNAGKSYVVFGKTDANVINLSAIASGTGGFVMNGEHDSDFSGNSVSSAGDVNGDGLDDLIVGANGAGTKGGSYTEGKSYVVFGKTDTNVINLSAIAGGMGGFVINGGTMFEHSGNLVSSAGDVNGDGLDDLIIGADAADANSQDRAGKSYVVFGKTDTKAIDLGAIESGTGGFVMNGESAYDCSGHSVSSAGDVNGDGLDDLIVGAYGANRYNGRSYVVFGKTDTSVINLSAIVNGTGGFAINGEETHPQSVSGYSVSSAGDVNGDGLDDLIIGANGADENKGKSYVVFGKTDTKVIDLSAIASGTGGFVINGESANDWSGHSVSSAGDVNGDGLDDLIIGASRADPINADNAGKSYVVFGKTDTDVVDLSAIASGTEMNETVSPLEDVIDLSAIASGTGGFVINGESAYDHSGHSVSSAGDVNGDGLDDLIVGAWGADSRAGRSYVIFGKTDTKAINLSALGGDSKYAIDFLGDAHANTLTGTSNDEIFVAGAGDDILIGNGGMDVFNAGAGNDLIIINASNLTELEKVETGNHTNTNDSGNMNTLKLDDLDPTLDFPKSEKVEVSNRANINGGGNVDTLKLDGSDLTLDFTKISNNRIKDIEKIDLTGSGDNTFKVNLNDVLDASTSTNILKVWGNSGDKVDIDTSKWISSSETKMDSGIAYNVYTNADVNIGANAALWIDTELSVI